MKAPDVVVNASRSMASAVGTAHGVTPGEMKEMAGLVLSAHKELVKERREGRYGFFDLHKDKALVREVESTAKGLSGGGHENFVILGIGGSALGIRALATALLHPYHNVLDGEGRGGAPRVFVMDNIDPDTFRGMLDICPAEKTLYNVISKSGGTAETLSQLLVVVDVLEKALGRGALKDHLVVTTGMGGGKANPLERMAKSFSLKTFSIPENVGGRFSIFSAVGLFPAAVLGIDVGALLRGCAQMDKRCSRGGLRENPAYLRAAVHYLLDSRKGKSMAVMMPYADSLRDVADWYRQIWAESLGKRFDLDGEEVFVGQTPIRALGATDQHSQVQLYREGPNNKVITTVEVRRFSKRVRLPEALGDIGELGYLRGQSLNRLMKAELEGTVGALKESCRPVLRVVMPCVNAHSFGQLLYMLEVETAMAGKLYHVDAFDQPAVERGKELAREYMRSGR